MNPTPPDPLPIIHIILPAAAYENYRFSDGHDSHSPMSELSPRNPVCTQNHGILADDLFNVKQRITRVLEKARHDLEECKTQLLTINDRARHCTADGSIDRIGVNDVTAQVIELSGALGKINAHLIECEKEQQPFAYPAPSDIRDK